MTIHRMLAATAVLLLMAAVAGCGSSPAETPTNEAATAAPALPELPAADGDSPLASRLVPTFKGEAELGYMAPVARTQGTTRVTTIKVKNLSNEAIAGLTVDETWFDKDNTQVAGSPTFRYARLAPGEVIDVRLEVEMRAGMERSTYKFAHANGTIKTTLLQSIDDEAP